MSACARRRDGAADGAADGAVDVRDLAFWWWDGSLDAARRQAADDGCVVECVVPVPLDAPFRHDMYAVLRPRAVPLVGERDPVASPARPPLPSSASSSSAAAERPPPPPPPRDAPTWPRVHGRGTAAKGHYRAFLDALCQDLGTARIATIAKGDDPKSKERIRLSLTGHDGAVVDRVAKSPHHAYLLLRSHAGFDVNAALADEAEVARRFPAVLCLDARCFAVAAAPPAAPPPAPARKPAGKKRKKAGADVAADAAGGCA